MHFISLGRIGLRLGTGFGVVAGGDDDKFDDWLLVVFVAIATAAAAGGGGLGTGCLLILYICITKILDIK